MGSNKELLLVHAGMKRVFLSHSVDVMLTPQYYTLKKEELPVKYLYQAKKIAPSLFEGLLEEVGTYEYLVYKEEGKWVFIAYNPGQIRSLLLSKGIKPEEVGKIFFAQQALEHFTAPVLLGEGEALVALDNTVVVVPQAALDEEVKPIPFTNSFTPRTGITLKGMHGGSLLTMKQAIALAVIFIVFAAIFTAEGLRYSKGSNALQAEMQELQEAYPSLQSRIQRESIADKYRSIDSKERRKREIIKSLSGLIFKGATLTSLLVNDKGFKAQFSCSDEKVAGRLSQLAKKEKFPKVKNTGRNSVEIEGVL
ncbi:hypothetical protein [Sulfurovum sp.]|uniref:hypothetical protein n=1 Tax=Sulfurovum sp. TaxID=1969726 RepID=UPI0025DBC1D6|nr:hypothetical protein [Sulfurovum sp.]